MDCIMVAADLYGALHIPFMARLHRYAMQTKSVVSSPLFYTAASLLYLAALVAWGSDGLFNSIWTAAKQALADQQVML